MEIHGPTSRDRAQQHIGFARMSQRVSGNQSEGRGPLRVNVRLSPVPKRRLDRIIKFLPLPMLP
jgi:hypothetical protein